MHLDKSIHGIDYLFLTLRVKSDYDIWHLKQRVVSEIASLLDEIGTRNDHTPKSG